MDAEEEVGDHDPFVCEGISITIGEAQFESIKMKCEIQERKFVWDIADTSVHVNWDDIAFVSTTYLENRATFELESRIPLGIGDTVSRFHLLEFERGKFRDFYYDMMVVGGEIATVLTRERGVDIEEAIGAHPFDNVLQVVEEEDNGSALQNLFLERLEEEVPTATIPKEFKDEDLEGWL